MINNATPYSREINLRDLTARIFGANALPFIGFGLFTDSQTPKDASKFSNKGVLAVNEAEGFQDETTLLQNVADSYGGVDVYPSAGAGVPMGKFYFMPTTLGAYKLPNEPLVSLQVQKRIIRTVVAGSTRRGTVKELVATEDYKVSIKGVIVNEEDPEAYPESDVSALRRLVEQRVAVSIDNTLCRLMGINKVIVTGLTLNADVGFAGMQSYELNCESDNDFEFELLK